MIPPAADVCQPGETVPHTSVQPLLAFTIYAWLDALRVSLCIMTDSQLHVHFWSSSSITTVLQQSREIISWIMSALQTTKWSSGQEIDDLLYWFLTKWKLTVSQIWFVLPHGKIKEKQHFTHVRWFQTLEQGNTPQCSVECILIDTLLGVTVAKYFILDTVHLCGKQREGRHGPHLTHLSREASGSTLTRFHCHNIDIPACDTAQDQLSLCNQHVDTPYLQHIVLTERPVKLKCTWRTMYICVRCWNACPLVFVLRTWKEEQKVSCKKKCRGTGNKIGLVYKVKLLTLLKKI